MRLFWLFEEDTRAMNICFLVYLKKVITAYDHSKTRIHCILIMVILVDSDYTQHKKDNAISLLTKVGQQKVNFQTS